MKAGAAVVIRCRDEERWLGQVLDAVLGQTIPVEVVVVDSGSRDGSVEIARSKRVRVEQIPPESFTFGHALNLGFGWTEAPLVVALSAHALPVNEHWLERLTAPFDDPQVAAAYGRQLPHADLDPFRRHQVLQYWGAEPRVDTVGEVRFSNANGAVRRTAWEECPWDEDLAASEDRIWGETIAARGGRIVYVPAAAVYHSHLERARAVYRRRRAELSSAGIQPGDGQRSLRRYLGAIKGDMRLIARRPKEWHWVWWSPVFRASEILGERAATRRR
jgi:rhamnosyltransferase